MSCDKHDGIYDTIRLALRNGNKAGRDEADTYLRLIRSCDDCREFHDRARRIWAEETAAAMPNDMTPYRINQRFQWWWQSDRARADNPRTWRYKLEAWNAAVADWR